LHVCVSRNRVFEGAGGRGGDVWLAYNAPCERRVQILNFR